MGPWAGLIAAILGLLATPAVAAEPAPPISVVRLTSGPWEPWSGTDLPEGGIATRIVRDAFAAQGIRVEIGWFPWPRAWELAQSGGWDGSFAWVTDTTRLRTMRFSDPVYVGTSVFMHRSGEPLTWNSIDDLAGKRIGVTVGYSYGPDFAAAVAAGRLTIDPAPSDEINLRKLIGGRIDLFPIDNIVGLALARRELGADALKLSYHPRPLLRAGNHLVVRKDHPRADDILRAFNAGLAAVHERGDPSRWIERWQPRP